MLLSFHQQGYHHFYFQLLTHNFQRPHLHRHRLHTSGLARVEKSFRNSLPHILDQLNANIVLCYCFSIPILIQEIAQIVLAPSLMEIFYFLERYGWDH